ncbi:MAG: tRNA-dihydrouridine synthase family protein [Planctomycetota bacterium]|nr:tRNA-dihydrouridine synthase family protein [Planctomycetota bacterium]
MAALPYPSPNLLAPMEGVTDPLFRDLVLARNGAEHLGGATTEVVRVVDHGLAARILAAALGRAQAGDPPAPGDHGRPVGLQLMGADLGAMAATAAAAVEAGAPLVDINFGCPAKGALRGCAGASLLDEPRAVEALVRAVTDAVEDAVPVSAKIRAGGEDDQLLEDLCRATEAGGAALVTVHCRTRAEAYRDTADWQRLRRAVAAVTIPVCGNGGVEQHTDLARLLQETGCAYAMVGRAALADPWIFSGHRATNAESAAFLLEYAAGLTARGFPGAGGRGGSRVKQLLAHWRAGDGPHGLLGPDRRAWLRIPNEDELLDAIARAGSL